MKFLIDMFRFSFVIIILVFSLFSANLVAIEVNDLYEANVVVDSQDKKQREQAIKEALQSVFLKVGGRKSALTHKVLQQAQQRASSYVSQYHYKRDNDVLSLVVSFNEDKVNQLFKKANLAQWGSLRPQILLWLIDEQGISRSIIASNADSIIPSAVKDFSVKRGLPIIMPLMDLTDNEQVLLSDFWGYFPEQIQQASQRYFADTVVVMRVSDSSLLFDTQNSEEIIDSATLATLDDISCGLLCEQEELIIPKVLDWHVLTQGAIYTQQYQGIDKVSLINQGLSDITELIYQSYALLASAEHDFVIEVNNVTSLKNDTQLFDFLSDLSAVKAVTLISANGDIRQFKLDLIGSKTAFLASLKLNNKLTQLPDRQPNDFSYGQTGENSDYNQANLGVVPHEYSQLKVIVLGQPVIAIDNTDSESLIQPQSASDDDFLVSEPPKQDSRNTDVNSVAELVDNEMQKLLEANKPLKAKPKTPVFYWEQG